MKRFAVGPLIAGLVLMAGISIAAQSKGVIVERVLVRVNGEIFTQTELTQRQVEALRDKNLTGPMTDARLEQELATVTPDILVAVVDDLLLVQRGREMGVKFT